MDRRECQARAVDLRVWRFIESAPSPQGFSITLSLHVRCAGNSCPLGSATPQACSAGSYQNATGAVACASCPPSFYCAGGSVNPAVCPAGSWCPDGTLSATQFLCPSGTFSSTAGLRNASQCTPCTAGSYCATPGLTAPTGLCSAGYYCLGGASIATPTEGADLGYTCSVGTGDWNASAVPVTGDACPPGHTCVAGSWAPAPCPPGSFLNTSRATSPAACQPCLPGFVCSDYATVTPRVACPPGYACSGGNVNGTETPCALGHACPGGVATGTACSPGSYADVVGLVACKTCPARFFCLAGQISPLPCPPAAVCAAGSSVAYPVVCGAGTFSARGSLALASECSPCLPGAYCATANLTAPTGSCAAGYQCFANATSSTPTDGVTGAVCPQGAFCPSGSSSPTLCPPGTFNNVTGVAALAGCRACPGGLTCPSFGLVTPSRPCDAGFSCSGSIAVVGSAQLCPAGSACVAGSAAPSGCAAGMYVNASGRSACLVCPQGYACAAGTATPTLCRPGYACPAGSVTGLENPCPAGTFSPLAGIASTAECQPCSAGMWCGSAGLTAPTGSCAAGYYCTGGSSVSAPRAAGSFSCSAVSGAGLGCPPYFNRTSNSSYPASSLYVSTAVVPVTVGDICPLGHVCPAGSRAPTPW